MKIILGGKSGTGKSAIGRMLVEHFGYKFMSGGNIFRQTGQDLGFTVEEFDKMLNASNDFKYDLILDQKQKEFGEKNNDFVLDSHLGWYNVPDAIKIKLFCEDNVRFQRTSKVDKHRIGTVIEDFESTMKKSLQRESDLKERINKIYGVEDLYADEHFDLVIDTTKLNIDNVFLKCLEFINSCKKLE